MSENSLIISSKGKTNDLHFKYQQQFFFFFSFYLLFFFNFTFYGFSWVSSSIITLLLRLFLSLDSAFLLVLDFYFFFPSTIQSLSRIFRPSCSNNTSIFVPYLALVSKNNAALCFFAISSPSSLDTYLSFSISHLFPTKARIIDDFEWFAKSLIHTSTSSNDFLFAIE